MPSDFKCPVCGVFKKIKPHEIKTRKACSRDCLRILKPPKIVTRECLVCSAVFNVSECQSKRGGRVCSLSCGGKLARMRGPQSPIQICETCKKPFKARSELVKKGQARFCSKPCLGPYMTQVKKGRRVEYIKKSCLICNEPFEVPPNRKVQKTCSRFCNTQFASSHNKYANSSIEQRIKSFLQSEEIIFSFQKKIGRVAFPDFVIGNICIFADGDYWHNFPNGTEKDRKQDAALKDLGFKVLRFWERDINNNFDKVSNEILEEIRKNAK